MAGGKVRVFLRRNGDFTDKPKVMAFTPSAGLATVSRRALKKKFPEAKGSPSAGDVGDGPPGGPGGSVPEVEGIVEGGVVYVAILSGEYKGQYVEADVNEILDNGNLDVTIRDTDLAQKAAVNEVRIENCDMKYIRTSLGQSITDVFSGMEPRLFSDGSEVTDVADIVADANLVVSRGELFIPNHIEETQCGMKSSIRSGECKAIIRGCSCIHHQHKKGKGTTEQVGTMDGNLEILQVIEDKGKTRFVIRCGPGFTLVLRDEMPCIVASRPPRQLVFAAKKYFSLSSDVHIFQVFLPESKEVTTQMMHIEDLLKTTEAALIQCPQSDANGVLGFTIKMLPDKVAQVGNKVADMVDRGGKSAVVGIRSVAKGTGSALKRTTEFLKTKIKQKERPVTVSSEMKTRLKSAKMLTTGAVTVTRALMTGACTTASIISKELAAAAEKSEVGKKLANSDSKRIQAAKNFTKSAVTSASSIWEATVDAGLSVLKDISTATGEVLEHRYGSEVGGAAKEGSEIFNNMAQSAVNMSKLGVTSMAKTVVKNSTVELCTDPLERKAKPQLNANAAMALAMLSAQQEEAGSEEES